MRADRASILFSFAAAASAVLVACGGDDGEATATKTSDVVAACDIRSRWTRADAPDCRACVYNATQAKCDCIDDPALGLCRSEHEAIIFAADCGGSFEACVQRCEADCACVDGCFVENAECRAMMGARDGCVADACESRCR
jgi:hypothetical protein